MIIITGAAGFIGSCLIWELNKISIKNIICVDCFDVPGQWKNIAAREFVDIIDVNSIDELKKMSSNVEAIIHLGACTSTIRTDAKYIMEYNYMFSKRIYNLCEFLNSRLIYMSSASVYGQGEDGFSEDSRCNPQSIYAFSKSLFDQWCLHRLKRIKQCVGLRLFNVYGPNEWHKGAMASLITKFYSSIKNGMPIQVFGDGKQQRDFVYVFDVVKVIIYFLNHPEISGIYNVGTGKATSFEQILKIFKDNMCDKNIDVSFESLPIEIKHHYQYYTSADLSRLRGAGYDREFVSVEDGIKKYITMYNPDSIVGSDYKGELCMN